jgi:hypothetical protein
VGESFCSILNLTRDALSETVVDEAAFSQLSRLCEALPAEFSTFWGFESRLGESRATADILFEIKKQSFGHVLLTGETPSALDPLCERWSTWKKLRDYARVWAEPDHEFHTHIRNIWLEFDMAAVSSAEHVQRTRRPVYLLGPHSRPAIKRQLPSHDVSGNGCFSTS